MNLTIPSITANTKSKVHFYFLDALRGIAVLWVILFHAPLDGRLVQLTSVLPQWVVNIVFNCGGFGVPIFFVLSGFVIAHSLREAHIDLAYFKRFCLRRFIRLTPAYYISIVITLGFAIASSYIKGDAFAPAKEALSFERLFLHLFYLQDIFRVEHINDVYWTLCLEIQFYIIFCALLGLAQWLKYSWNLSYSRAVVFGSAAIIAALFPMGMFVDSRRAFFFLPLWYAFLLGVFAYWSWRDKLNPMYFYFYSALLLTAGTLKSTTFVVACVIVAILLLEVGRADCMQSLKERSLQFLGHISYSLYLTHIPVYGAVFFLGSKLLNRNAWSEAFCVLLATLASVGFAAIMWQLVEKPSINLSQKVKLVEAR